MKQIQLSRINLRLIELIKLEIKNETFTNLIEDTMSKWSVFEVDRDSRCTARFKVCIARPFLAMHVHREVCACTLCADITVGLR